MMMMEGREALGRNDDTNGVIMINGKCIVANWMANNSI